MKRSIMLLAVFWIFLGVSLVPDLTGSARTPGAASVANGYDLVGAVNFLRISNGLAAYNVNSILMTIAQDQANYLASTGGVYGHIGPGGTRPYQRALAAGYSVAGDLSLGGLFSENWAESSSVQSAVNSWMGDSAHRGTMLSSDLADVGGGIASSGGMNYYVIDAGLSTGSKLPSGSTGSGTSVIASGTPASQEPTVAMAIVNTPDKNGNIYYVVQPGQTLWQIAVAYKTTVDQIKLYNNLSSDSIYAGQKLFISKVGTLTPTSAGVTATRDLSTYTPLPTFVVFTDTPTASMTPVPVAPVSAPGGAGGAVVAIILVALVAAALVAWAGRSRSV